MLSLCLLHLARTSKTYRRRTPIACTLSRHSPFPTVPLHFELGARWYLLFIAIANAKVRNRSTLTHSNWVCLLLTHATRFTIIYGQGFNKSTRIRSAHHNSCGIFNGSVAKFHRFRGQREIANKKKKSQQVLGRSNRSRECVRAACMPSR